MAEFNDVWDMLPDPEIVYQTPSVITPQDDLITQTMSGEGLFADAAQIGATELGEISMNPLPDLTRYTSVEPAPLPRAPSVWDRLLDRVFGTGQRIIEAKVIGPAYNPIANQLPTRANINPQPSLLDRLLGRTSLPPNAYYQNTRNDLGMWLIGGVILFMLTFLAISFVRR